MNHSPYVNYTAEELIKIAELEGNELALELSARLHTEQDIDDLNAEHEKELDELRDELAELREKVESRDKALDALDAVEEAISNLKRCLEEAT